MALTTPDAPLALPAGAEPADVRTAQPLAAFLGGAALAAFFGALIAAYLTLRAGVTDWPPEGVEFDNYLGTTLTLTALLSMPAIEWAVYAIRNGFRGQALTALAITMALGTAFVVGLWYLVDDRWTYSAGDSAYGVMTHAMIIAVGASALVAVGYAAVSFFRVAGSQLTAANPYLMRATAWYWHFTAAAWVAVWLTIFVTK